MDNYFAIYLKISPENGLTVYLVKFTGIKFGKEKLDNKETTF